MKGWIILFALVPLFWIGCKEGGGIVDPPVETTSNINGTVRQTGTSVPISGVLVTTGQISATTGVGRWAARTG